MKRRSNQPATSEQSATSCRANRAGSREQEASAEARRLAAAIVEVLAGFRTTTEAAQGLGVSVARYYQMEVRALDGLVRACEPRRGRRAGNDLALLQRECERLRHECARQQALMRATRRTVGLADTAAAPPSEPRLKRRRRPTARALKVVRELRTEAADAPARQSETANDSSPAAEVEPTPEVLPPR
jgi:hypothetical protein